MTLIAGFCFERVPMLLGDLLLSSPHPSGEQHIELPSVGDSREIIKPDWGYALDLCQKIFLVNRFTAVSWCGSYIKAKGLLTEFQTLAGDQRLSSAREKDFLSAISSDNYYADVSLIGMTAISGMASRFFGCNFYNRANEHFSPCLYAGSGGVDFPGTAELRPPILAEGSSVDRATSVAYSLIGAFLTREINARSLATDTTPNPLLDLYGGGWELAFVDEGSVFKHKNTTEFFWKLNEHDDGTLEIQAPSLILKTDYAGAFLVRRWLRGSGSPRWSAPWSEQRCTVTKPIVGGGSPIDVSDPLTWPPLESRHQVHVVLVTSSKGKRFVLTWTYWLHPQEASANVLFTESSADRCTIVDVQPRAVQMILSLFQSAFDRIRKAGEW